MKIKQITAFAMAAVMATALTACSMGNPKKSMEDGKKMEDMASMESAKEMDEMNSMEDSKGVDKENSMEDNKDMGDGKSMDGDKKMDQMDAMKTEKSMAENTGMEKFPAFEGMDLEGNAVKSEELFGGNAATVVNFWFTTCGPCVGELSELDALNKELADKGAALVGINAFTIGGDPATIADAKEVLTKKGAAYRNVYFDAESEAGKFAEGVYAFPTTYVVDRSGNMVGEPVVGAVTDPKQKKAVWELVDKALAMDTEHMG